MDTKELRSHSVQHLPDLIGKAASSIRELRFAILSRQQTHVRDIRKAKRDLARMKTVLREKQISGDSSNEL